jgi:hypothetical protein
VKALAIEQIVFRVILNPYYPEDDLFNPEALTRPKFLALKWKEHAFINQIILHNEFYLKKISIPTKFL